MSVNGDHETSIISTETHMFLQKQAHQYVQIFSVRFQHCVDAFFIHACMEHACMRASLTGFMCVRACVCVCVFPYKYHLNVKNDIANFIVLIHFKIGPCFKEIR